MKRYPRTVRERIMLFWNHLAGYRLLRIYGSSELGWYTFNAETQGWEMDISGSPWSKSVTTEV
jgi:hypothetical protein